ncbi:hypothetical protein SPRG_18665 [Saprolegnia parasitica CBS 223.65]|uniref:Uncharacterized protein n=1 Tax=Saprolegnia parasitica (strain CBS 223.65) TaxID=695850 RepID=A0A067BBR8_SAPPC|nr:hypothetical protein SPRG_18665 [Saprolegnia parasitica CBS 223.65]KDO15799.1 hypothetical protein SPRG_18665 [Saprolegnia parasitica CBS 223.65]|eukprot:XP_012213492.1 hypothetical protein SPRG_18665 [Saprolegnia parasitica CBS 223.65]
MAMRFDNQCDGLAADTRSSSLVADKKGHSMAASPEADDANQDDDDVEATHVEYDDDDEYTSEDGDDDDADDGLEGKDFAMFKVLVVGMAKSGKTSLIRRFVHGTFADIYKTTVGADYSDKTIAIDDTLDVCLQIWDIAGQDRFAHLTRRYFAAADAAVIVCDITSEPTIAAVVDWKRELDTCCGVQGTSTPFPVLLVANKCDLLLDVPQALESGVAIQKMVTTTGIEDWFRVSAKSGEKVDEAMDLLVKRMVERHRAKQASEEEHEAAIEDKLAAVSSSDIIRLDAASTGAPPPFSSGRCDCN